jgi:hypothetical protein
MIHIVRLFLGAVVLAVVCTVAMADRIRTIPGTTVSVTIADNFQERVGVAGLVNPETGASLIVTELPGPAFPEVARLFSTVEALNAWSSKQGVIFSTIEDLLSANGEKIKLAHGIQDAVHGRSDKWMAVFRGAKTAMVTMQVSKELAFDPAMARAVFASVALGEPLSQEELIALLPFKIDIVAPFRFLGTPTGSGILLTIGADDLNSGSRQPIVMVVRQVSEVKPEQLEQMAESQLRSTSSFAVANISGQAPVEFAKSTGILMEGDLEKDGTKLNFRQYFSVTDDGKFIRLVAAAPAGQMGSIVPLIEKIARSVEVK